MSPAWVYDQQFWQYFCQVLQEVSSLSRQVCGFASPSTTPWAPPIKADGSGEEKQDNNVTLSLFGREPNLKKCQTQLPKLPRMGFRTSPTLSLNLFVYSKR